VDQADSAESTVGWERSRGRFQSVHLDRKSSKSLFFRLRAHKGKTLAGWEALIPQRHMMQTR